MNGDDNLLVTDYSLAAHRSAKEAASEAGRMLERRAARFCVFFGGLLLSSVTANAQVVELRPVLAGAATDRH
jgi:hypothetical protein